MNPLKQRVPSHVPPTKVLQLLENFTINHPIHTLAYGDYEVLLQYFLCLQNINLIKTLKFLKTFNVM
jgi:hypothetical protein